MEKQDCFSEKKPSKSLSKIENSKIQETENKVNNIWILNHYAIDKGRHYYFSKELSKRGFNVKLISAGFKHYSLIETKNYEEKFFNKELMNNFERIWIKTLPYKKNDYKRVLNQIHFAINSYRLNKKINSPDLIYGSSGHLFTGLSSYFLAKKFNIPFIFEIRDIWPQTLVEMGEYSIYHPAIIFFKRLEKFLYNKADVIISVLPEGDKYINSLGINQNKVKYIPNGVSLKWFDEKASKSINDNEIINFIEEMKENKLIFTYTGAHSKANGLKTLIRAIKLAEDYNLNNHYILIGDGTEKEQLINLSKKLDLNNITFFDSVSKDVIPKILSNSDVHLSIVKKNNIHKYGISMRKNFDYMASGKPYLSSLTANFDFVNKANCGFNSPADNPKKLSDNIKRISEMSDKKRKKIGENGRRYVENYHNYTNLSLKLFSIINDLLE